jgi:hypothetical protein
MGSHSAFGQVLAHKSGNWKVIDLLTKCTRMHKFAYSLSKKFPGATSPDAYLLGPAPPDTWGEGGEGLGKGAGGGGMGKGRGGETRVGGREKEGREG